MDESTRISTFEINAEHAIKAFARLRKVISGTSTKKGVEEYLTLLTVAQSCEYSGIDFLDFLRSGERDIERFAIRKRRPRLPESPNKNNAF